jgi:hypothetical protein
MSRPARWTAALALAASLTGAAWVVAAAQSPCCPRCERCAASLCKDVPGTLSPRADALGSTSLAVACAPSSLHFFPPSVAYAASGAAPLVTASPGYRAPLRR